MKCLREKERVPAATIIRYWAQDRNMMISQAYDISEKGITFNTGKKYPTQSPIYIQMRSPENFDQIIFFKARIVHQEPLSRHNLYKTGAEITRFKDTADRKMLLRYIQFARDCVN